MSIGVMCLVGCLLAAAPPDFARDVEPLLRARCYPCHGPEKQLSGLRLDRREVAVAPAASGRRAIVPGQPGESRLLKVIAEGGDEGVSMPPGGARLTADEVAVLTAWIAAGAEYPLPVDYLTAIAPLLERHCVSCHGPQQQQGGLRLDTPDGLFAGGDSGRPTVLPGKPDESELLARITSREPGRMMPPAGPRLRAGEVERLRTWIGQGAPVPAGGPRPVVTSDHWAFQPRRAAVPPGVEQAGWARNPIDAFVLRELELRDLKPSPEADRRTLIRRLSLDLLGLPPDPAAVEAFVADAAPDAYERLVDRLLASPHFGERWARPWLDLARYADSDGYEKDSPRPHAWRWRDWLIDAVNRDLSFDQFTIEQLAGDLLPNATLEQRVATGFHRNTLTNREGGVDPEQYRVEQIVDRTNTTSTVWLGLTMACAQCHTHKYDPLSQREYFSLYAFFNDSDEEDLAAPTPAELAAYNAARERFDAEHAALREQSAAAIAAYERDRLPAEQAAWEATPARWEVNWTPLRPESVRGSRGGTRFERLDDGSFRAVGPSPERDVYRVEAPAAGRITGVRLELLADPLLPHGGPGRAGNGNLVLSEFELTLLPAEGEPRPLRLAAVEADGEQAGYAAAESIDGQAGTGWALLPTIGQHRVAVFTLAEPLEPPPGARLRFALAQNYGGAHTIGRFRLALTDQPPALALAADAWRPLERATVESVAGPSFTVRDDHSVLVAGENPETERYTVTARAPTGRLTGLRLEALPDPSLGQGGPGRVGHGNFVLTELSVTARWADQSRELTLRAATSDHDQTDFPVAEAIDGNRDDTRVNGWAVMPQAGVRHRAAFEIVDPPAVDEPVELEVRLDQLWGDRHTLGCFRLAVTSDPYPIDVRELTEPLRLALTTPAADRTAEQTAALAAYYRAQDPFLAEQQRQLAGREGQAPKPPETLAQALRQRAEPRETRVHTRGDFLRPGAPVEPAVPAVLPPLTARGPRPDRLDLARWLVDPANPLPARVEVNRVWRGLFGAGLVRTPEDFGTRGEPPTHPELLDWLAGTFIDHGWSRKALIRLIATSAAYRQSSAGRAELRELDPENRFLARQNRYRVESEIVRDLNLAAGGLLTATVGGPSARPPLPAGMTNLNYANGMRWDESRGPDRYRRGLYIFFQRTVPYPMLMTFDQPDSNVACTRRERSNTPLQALTTLNDPVLFECAQAFGRRVIGEAADTPARIERAYALCFGRPPSAREQEIVARLYDQMREPCADLDRARQVAGLPEPPAEQLTETATWTAVARVLLNTDEFLTRE